MHSNVDIHRLHRGCFHLYIDSDFSFPFQSRLDLLTQRLLWYACRGGHIDVHRTDPSGPAHGSGRRHPGIQHSFRLVKSGVGPVGQALITVQDPAAQGFIVFCILSAGESRWIAAADDTRRWRGQKQHRIRRRISCRAGFHRLRRHIREGFPRSQSRFPHRFIAHPHSVETYGSCRNGKILLRRGTHGKAHRTCSFYCSTAFQRPCLRMIVQINSLGCLRKTLPLHPVHLNIKGLHLRRHGIQPHRQIAGMRNIPPDAL